MPLHHSAAIETLVLDDAPIEVRLAVLPPFGSSKEHNDVDSITKTIPWESGRSSLQAFLTILWIAHTFQIKYLRTKKIVKPAFPPANPRSRARREELWITSKLWNDMHGEKDVMTSCRKSLADLRLDYLDLFLVHWPFPNFHPPACDVTSRSPNAKPYIHADYMKTWRKMEELVDLNLVRHIGTSNMTIPKLKLVLRDARIKPAVNEMELHPHFQQPELFRFVVDNGMQPIGYCPLGSPARPCRIHTSQVAGAPSELAGKRTRQDQARVGEGLGAPILPDTP